MIRSHLADVQRQRDPHTVVNDRDWLARGPVMVANGRWVPPVGFEMPDEIGPWVGLCRPARLCVGRSRRRRRLEPRRDRGSSDGGRARRTGGRRRVDRPSLGPGRPEGAHLERDFAAAGKVGVSNQHLAKLALVGPVDRLWIHETARIDPYTVFDTTNGPIIARPRRLGPAVHADRRARARSAADTQLFRANIRGGVTIGPNCRIGGEVEAVDRPRLFQQVP